MFSLLPDFSNGISVPSLAPIFGKLSFSGIHIGQFIVVVFAFLFVDLFDTLGTLIGVSTKANMIDEDGKLPKIKGASMADAVATTAGAVIGTQQLLHLWKVNILEFRKVEELGYTAVTTAILFGASLLLSPIFLAIPSFATAPALVVVGFYMLLNVVNIDFTDFTEGIPCLSVLRQCRFSIAFQKEFQWE